MLEVHADGVHKQNREAARSNMRSGALDRRINAPEWTNIEFSGKPCFLHPVTHDTTPCQRSGRDQRAILSTLERDALLRQKKQSAYMRLKEFLNL